MLKRFLQKEYFSNLNKKTKRILHFIVKRILPRSNTQSTPLSILITTYDKRFENSLIPILQDLKFQVEGRQIFIVANGNKTGNEKYKKKLDLLKDIIPDINIYLFNDSVGLSKMWNKGISIAKTKKILILNDDISLWPNFIKSLKTLDGLTTFNNSWSAFILSMGIYKKVGPFDENLLEIGGEDDDYIARLAYLEIHPHSKSSIKVEHRFQNKLELVDGYKNSYGKEMIKENGGYSSLNTDYLNKKWQYSNKKFEGAVEVKGRDYKYWKLR